MRSRIFLILFILLSLSAGCDSKRHELGPASSTVREANLLHHSAGTNLSRLITEEEAAAIARQEAIRRGRSGISVSSVTFKEREREWRVGLDFEPEDVLGNYAVVLIATNGIVRQYLHGF